MITQEVLGDDPAHRYSCAQCLAPLLHTQYLNLSPHPRVASPVCTFNLLTWHLYNYAHLNKSCFDPLLLLSLCIAYIYRVDTGTN